MVKVVWFVVDIIKYVVLLCDMVMICGNMEERRKVY